MFDEEESDDEGHRPLFFLFSRCCQLQPGELDQPGKMWNEETPKVAWPVMNTHDGPFSLMTFLYIADRWKQFTKYNFRLKVFFSHLEKKEMLILVVGRAIVSILQLISTLDHSPLQMCQNLIMITTSQVPQPTCFWKWQLGTWLDHHHHPHRCQLGHADGLHLRGHRVWEEVRVVQRARPLVLAWQPIRVKRGIIGILEICIETWQRETWLEFWQKQWFHDMGGRYKKYRLWDLEDAASLPVLFLWLCLATETWYIGTFSSITLGALSLKGCAISPFTKLKWLSWSQSQWSPLTW